MPIPVIDLFAGPGGLGEGFSTVLRPDCARAFKIKLSIEMDEYAHCTLELRAFLREFAPGKAPAEYYDYLAGCITREKLFSLYKNEAQRAAKEAWHAELGSAQTTTDDVDERIRAALGKTMRNWVLIGGPPCQAYSLVGRSRVVGAAGREKHEADPRQKLYLHYLRILAVHQPAVFVMENVKGLLSAKVKDESVFERILRDLRHPVAALPELRGNADEKTEYRLLPLTVNTGDLNGIFKPADFVVRSEKHGIPQARHRVIILGIRSDIKGTPAMLEPQPEVYIEQAIGDLPRLRSGLSKEADSPEAWGNAIRAIIGADWMQRGAIDPDLRELLLAASRRIDTVLSRGAIFLPQTVRPERHANWFADPRLKGVCNHESRGHIRQDLHRYFFAAVFAQKYRRSPLLEDLPAGLLPEHRNVAAALKETKFNDRFRVQTKGRPATTMVSHISKDGHYFIHYDPTQCRSLTVREAARLQSFPDNYFFEGPRTEQYRQVGNAVPPLLAYQIAEIVRELLT
jgi:DNA (cytosine-5)-methyltransferase 1